MIIITTPLHQLMMIAHALTHTHLCTTWIIECKQHDKKKSFSCIWVCMGVCVCVVMFDFFFGGTIINQFLYVLLYLLFFTLCFGSFAYTKKTRRQHRIRATIVRIIYICVVKAFPGAGKHNLFNQLFWFIVVNATWRGQHYFFTHSLSLRTTKRGATISKCGYFLCVVCGGATRFAQIQWAKTLLAARTVLGRMISWLDFGLGFCVVCCVNGRKINLTHQHQTKQAKRQREEMKCLYRTRTERAQRRALIFEKFASDTECTFEYDDCQIGMWRDTSCSESERKFQMVSHGRAAAEKVL